MVVVLVVVVVVVNIIKKIHPTTGHEGPERE